jgi:hypothetical protein
MATSGRQEWKEETMMATSGRQEWKEETMIDHTFPFTLIHFKQAESTHGNSEMPSDGRPKVKTKFCRMDVLIWLLELEFKTKC